MGNGLSLAIEGPGVCFLHTIFRGKIYAMLEMERGDAVSAPLLRHGLSCQLRLAYLGAAAHVPRLLLESHASAVSCYDGCHDQRRRS